MRLELYINGSLFNALSIDDKVHYYPDFEGRCQAAEESVNYHINLMKSMFARQLTGADYQFYLITKSKVNEILKEQLARDTHPARTHSVWYVG